MDSITEKLSQLQELNDDELSTLESSALTEFETVEQADLTPQNVDLMEQLANAVEAIRSEKSRRVAEHEALVAKAAEASNRIKPVGEDADPNSNPDPEGLPPEVPGDETIDTAPVTEPVGGPSDVPSETVPTEEFKKKPPAAARQPAAASNETRAAAELSDQSDEQQSAPAAPVEQTEQPAEQAAPVETTDQPAEQAPAGNTDEAAPAAPAEQQTAATEAPEGSEASSDSESTTTEASAEAENSTNNNTTPEAPVTAAAQGGDSLEIEAPADRKPQIKPAATMSITAGADIPGISAGTRFQGMNEVSEAFMKRLHSLRHVHGGDGEQHIVASLQAEYPEERFLTANDPLNNTELMQKVTAPEAIMAAAGICLPLETRYDLGTDLGVTDRPVRDSLARFAADRGGIRWYKAPKVEDYAAATGFWRPDANGQNWATYQADGVTATSPANQKPCLEVQCVAEDVAFIEAVTLCLQFNNLTTRVFPELMRRHNELAMIAHAKVAENHLLAKLEAGSTAVTAQTQVVGATREIFNLLGRAVASYRFKNRMSNVSPLRMVAPVWLMDLMKADIALQMPGDGLNDVLGVADAQINAWFRARNVNITWHLDGVGPSLVDLDGAGAGTAKGFTFPGAIEFGLWAEGTWVFLDGGTLDLGVIRDSSLVATNQYKQFVETFEGLANMGAESYWVTANYVPTGQAASLVDTLA